MLSVLKEIQFWKNFFENWSMSCFQRILFDPVKWLYILRVCWFCSKKCHLERISMRWRGSLLWHDLFTYLAWLIHICDVTHAWMCHYSVMCDMTHSYVRQDSFICVTCPTHACLPHSQIRTGNDEIAKTTTLAQKAYADAATMVCVCVCVCVCTCVCMCMYMCVCVCVCVFAYSCVHTRMCTHVCARGSNGSKRCLVAHSRSHTSPVFLFACACMHGCVTSSLLPMPILHTLHHLETERGRESETDRERERERERLRHGLLTCG